MSHGYSNYYPQKHVKRNDCKTKCDALVDVDLNIKPKVACHPLTKTNAEFDFELDFEVSPRCRIEHKADIKDDCGCTKGCVFAVKFDFDCHPRILQNPCNKGHADFRVDVEAEFNPECHLKRQEKLKSKHDSSSSSSKSISKNKDHDYYKDKKDLFEEKKIIKKEWKKDDKKKDDCDCNVCKPRKKDDSSSSSSSNLNNYWNN